MRRLLLAAAAVLCACGPARRKAPPRVLTGLDVLEADGFRELRGKRVGLITNSTGVDRRGRSTADVLAAAPGVTLAAVFSPEHGFAAQSEASSIDSDRLSVGGRMVPLYSLYKGGAEGMRPTANQLAGLDALVFDVQDVGARFYTYLATMAMSLEAAKKSGVEFVVLDRPNPIGGLLVEGPTPDEAGLPGVDPVAYLDVATRHGLTAGEAALLDNAAVGHPDLVVVKLRHWTRSMWYDDTGLPWTRPSPNMPDLDAATLYPGIANLEFTNLSVGRGTPTPFGWVGAPWIDAKALADRLNAALLEGVRFEPATRTPSKDAYAGQACPGVRIVVTDREAARPLRIFVALAVALRDLNPNDFQLRWEHTRRLVGRHRFLELYESGAPASDFYPVFDEDSARFAERRKPYLLYPDK
jgi:uncharacterized protein YbbC (DUF1343 family)